jgi:hypothetical protein
MFGRGRRRGQQARMPEAMMRVAHTHTAVGWRTMPRFHLREVGSASGDRDLLARLMAHPPAWSNAIPDAEPQLDVANTLTAMLQRSGTRLQRSAGSAPWVPGVVRPPCAWPEQTKGGPTWDLPAFR